MTRKDKAACLLVAVAASSLMGAGPWGGQSDDVVLSALSADAFGVEAGAPVKVHGIEIGAVTDVALAHDPDRPDAPVRLTLRVSAHGATFLRERTVVIVERVQMGPGIPPFASPELALQTEGEQPLDPRAALDVVGGDTMSESFARLTREMTAVRARFDELGGLVQDLRTLTGGVARGEGAAGKLLLDPEAGESVAALLRDAKETSREMRQLVHDARTLSAEARPAIEDVRRLSQEGGRTLRSMGNTLEDLPALLEATERTLHEAEAMTRDLRTASRYAPELARKVDSSIEEANRLVEAAQRSLLLRGTLPARQRPRTEAEVRPPAREEAP